MSIFIDFLCLYLLIFLCLYLLNFSLYVFFLSRLYYLIYKIIIETCISIRAVVHFAINVML